MVSETIPQRLVIRTDHEEVQHILQSVWKYSSTYIVRNEKQRCSRWVFVFLMGVHQFSYVPSRMLPKTSFLDDNQEQQPKCEYFSDLITMRTREVRVKEGALCFWSTVPLHTDPHTYHRRSARSCIHLQLHVKGSVRLFYRLWNHAENLSESFVMSLFVRSTVCSSLSPQYWGQ